MLSKKFQILLCCVMLSVCGLVYGDDVVLVEDNRAFCTVVKGEATGESRAHSLLRSNVTKGIQPSGVLKQAANDLAEYLNDMGWIGEPRYTVKVVENAEQAKTRYRILLGTEAIEKYGLQEEAETLSYPGYIYRTIGNDLLIFGATSKGTANGVYGFLQNELGVRWFGPQELFTVVPREERVAVADLDKRKEPSTDN